MGVAHRRGPDAEALQGEPLRPEPGAAPARDRPLDRSPNRLDGQRLRRQPFLHRHHQPWPRIANNCWIMSFDTLTTWDEAWKPRWIRISSPNSWARSTFDASIWPETSLPPPGEPLAVRRYSPLPWLSNRPLPIRSNCSGLRKSAIATAPASSVLPFE